MEENTKKETTIDVVTIPRQEYAELIKRKSELEAMARKINRKQPFDIDEFSDICDLIVKKKGDEE